MMQELGIIAVGVFVIFTCVLWTSVTIHTNVKAKCFSFFFFMHTCFVYSMRRDMMRINMLGFILFVLSVAFTKQVNEKLT